MTPDHFRAWTHAEYAIQFHSKVLDSCHTGVISPNNFRQDDYHGQVHFLFHPGCAPSDIHFSSFHFFSFWFIFFLFHFLFDIQVKEVSTSTHAEWCTKYTVQCFLCEVFAILARQKNKVQQLTFIMASSAHHAVQCL